jgi:hypothetical protein
MSLQSRRSEFSWFKTEDYAPIESYNFADFVEMALLHAVSDKVEAAYRRGDLFEKRRRLMDAWASYCGRVEAAGKIVPLRSMV